MISFFEASLQSLSVHRVGNKSQDEFYVLSDAPVPVTPEQASYLMSYFLSPFQKVNEVFNFFHPSNILDLNSTYVLAKQIFEYELSFHACSQQIAKDLYDICNHPKIKSGELYIAYFENVQIDGELHDAIGIFKSENKQTYLKVSPVQEGFDLEFESDAINIDHLDKGCLIFNTDAEIGYRVVCLNEKGKDGSYWKDEFLGLKVVNDNFQQTNTVLGVFKSFVSDKLDEDYEISKTDKIDLLNNSMKYFKEKDSFDLEEFSNEVLIIPAAVSSFKEYKSVYDEEFDTLTPDSFDISAAAVKKQTTSFKPVLKLDKNFQIHIHGSKELIEKGFDQEKNLNFYKVYFKDEL